MNSVLRIGRLHRIWSTPACALQQILASSSTTSTRQTGAAVTTNTRKPPFLPRVTLVVQNQMQIMTLIEAQKLAKRRNLSLVQVQQMDTKTKRPVYKLVATGHDDAEDLQAATSGDKSGGQKKAEKLLTVGSRIDDHDLASRLKHISKWLAKRHEVRVHVQCSANDMAGGEKIFKAIEQAITTPEAVGKIVQKRSKGSMIKFHILPITPATDSNAPPA